MHLTLRNLSHGASSLLTIVGLALIALGCDAGSNQDPSTASAEPPPAERSWTTHDAAEIVRLPSGDLSLCNDRATSVADCPTVQGLDPEWPIARIVHEYPYIDPEDAAELVWNSARKRMIFSASGDTRAWSTDWLSERLVGIDASAAGIADLWATEWRRYHEMPGYRDLVAWRLQFFQSLQKAVGIGELDSLPSCDEQNRVLRFVAFCDLAEFIRPEWTVERVIEQYDGFNAADTADIVQLFWVDARDHGLAASDPPIVLWSPRDLEEKIAKQSGQRRRARARLLASGDYGFLAEPPGVGSAAAGKHVGECVAACEIPDERGPDVLKKEQACREECYAQSFATDS